MGSEVLLVSVVIAARDLASKVLSMLGANGLAALSPLQMGALGVAAGIAAIGIASAKAATDFDYNMQKIAALTNTSAAQMQSYKQQLLDMAPQLDQTPVALAQGLYFVISAGYSGAQALDILKLSAQAAASTMTPMAKVSDLLTTAMNAYRGANVSAGHAMDDLMSTVVQGKVTMSSLATSMGFVLVTAKNAGLSIDQASAAVATLSQVAGEHGSRRVMMDLDNSLRMVGIETEKVSAKAKTMKGLKAPWDAAKFAAMSYIEKLQYIAQETGGVGYLNKTQAAAYEATGNMSNLAQATAHANANFMTLVGGAAAFIPSAILLSDKGKEYNQILKTMGGNGQKTAKSFDIMRQSVGQQWQMFKTTLVTIATVLGENLLPAISKILMPLIALGHTIISFTQSSGGISTLKYVLLGLGIVITTLLAPAIGGLALALITVSAPVVAVIAGGIALGLAIRSVVQAMGGWQAILRTVHPLIVFVEQALARAGAELRKAFDSEDFRSALVALQTGLLQLRPVLEIVAVLVGTVLVVAFHLIVAGLRGFLAALPSVIYLVGSLFDLLGALGQFVIDLFTGKWSKLGADLEQIWWAIKLVFINAGNAILAWLGGFIGHFLELFGTNGDKVKAAAVQMLGGIKDAIGNFFGGIGSWIGSKLGGAGTAIGNFFSGIGTTIHNGLEDAKQTVQNGVNAILNFFSWLYAHNKYVRAFVAMVQNDLTLLRRIISTIILGVKSFLAAAWRDIQAGASAAWQLVYQHIVEPIQRAWHDVQAALGALKKWLGGIWSDIVAGAQLWWDQFIGNIASLKDRVFKAAHDAVVKPIQDAWHDLTVALSHAGENLLKMIGNDLANGKKYLEAGAKQALGKIADWLGFQSPAPKVPESAYWGRNLTKMFASSMLLAAPQVGLAAARVIAQAQRQLGANGATANLGVAAGGAAGGAFSVAGAATGGGGGAGTSGPTTIYASFPGVQSKDEIKKALQELQQADYRAGRRPGMYGGLTAHVARQ